MSVCLNGATGTRTQRCRFCLDATAHCTSFAFVPGIRDSAEGWSVPTGDDLTLIPGRSVRR
jgi:hypothetical protein